MSKRAFVLLIFLLGSSLVYAQNSNNFINVVSNTSLNWNIDTETEIENDQTIANALTIQVKNRSAPARSVYVRCSSITGPAGFTIPSIPLQIRYASGTSPNASSLITTAITITATDQRLFTHSQHPSNTTYSFYYDLIHTATNWNFPPGSYNYTLTFTFVNP